MSSAATLKAGAKRGFDEMAVDLPTGAGCSPLRPPLLAPAAKRARPAAAGGGAAPATARRPFTAGEVASLAAHVPKRLKRVAERVAAGACPTTERLFSVVDVRDIVESVLAEREAKLKEEFTRVLEERLAEQFRDFTKFNEDHVSRHLRGKDCTYLS